MKQRCPHIISAFFLLKLSTYHFQIRSHKHSYVWQIQRDRSVTCARIARVCRHAADQETGCWGPSTLKAVSPVSTHTKSLAYLYAVVYAVRSNWSIHLNIFKRWLLCEIKRCGSFFFSHTKESRASSCQELHRL